MKRDKRRNEEQGDMGAGDFNNDFNNENQDFNQPENMGGENEGGNEEGFDQEQSGGQGRNNRRRNRMQDEQDYQGEEDEGFEGDEEEDEEEETEGSSNGKGFQQIEQIAKKVMAYMKEHSQEMDKKTIAKYAAVGVLMLYGMRKNSVLGSMMVSIAAGVITKYILENTMDGQEQRSEAA